MLPRHILQMLTTAGSETFGKGGNTARHDMN
jgi:hypothetical protein